MNLKMSPSIFQYTICLSRRLELMEYFFYLFLFSFSFCLYFICNVFPSAIGRKWSSMFHTVWIIISTRTRYSKLCRAMSIRRNVTTSTTHTMISRDTGNDDHSWFWNSWSQEGENSPSMSFWSVPKFVNFNWCCNVYAESWCCSAAFCSVFML